MNSRETNARKSMAAKWVAESNASREARQAAAVAEQTPSVMQAFGTFKVVLTVLAGLVLGGGIVTLPLMLQVIDDIWGRNDR